MNSGSVLVSLSVERRAGVLGKPPRSLLPSVYCQWVSFFFRLGEFAASPRVAIFKIIRLVVELRFSVQVVGFGVSKVDWQDEN